MYEYDDLSIYRGRDIQISKDIVVTQPTLGQIEEFGEKKYFGAVQTLTSVGADLKWQLFDMGIDYMEISDYDLFLEVISQLVSSKKKYIDKMPIEEREKLKIDEIQELCDNPLSLILKRASDLQGLDLADFEVYRNNQKKQDVLYSKKYDIQIDRIVYTNIVNIVRKMHGYKRNNQIPANEATKMDLIEDARDEYLAASQKPFESVLKPLISGMINQSGFKCGHNDIWNMKVNAFFDSVKRIGMIQDAKLLLQGAYSGFANLKNIDKERLNWARKLDV